MGSIRDSRKAGSDGEERNSWFSDSPHYWAEASLPLAYAVAGVEDACKSSEKARGLYNGIVEARSDARPEVISLLGDGYTTVRQAQFDHNQLATLPQPR